MILTSIKNREVIKDNAESLGISFKVTDKTVKITPSGLDDNAVSSRLDDLGIGHIIDNTAVFV